MTHVLIVDDEPSICWAFRECLTDEGFSVDIAGTAEQALVIAAQNIPDVIVMDVRLPGMDGLKAMRHLRDKSVAVPVIIMTAFGSLKTAVDAIDGGAFDYLTKPIDLDKAVAVVRQAVSACGSACGSPRRSPRRTHRRTEFGRSFGRSFERNPERNVGQTLDRIVIDRRCEWEVGCSISGWRPCRLCLRSSRSAEVDGTDGSAAYAPDTLWGP